MACTPQFDSAIQFECVKDILAAIRNPTGDWKANGKKAAWVLGCALELFDGSETPPIVVAADTSLEDLAAQVEDSIGSDVTTQAINPALVALIIELILKFLASRK